MVKDRQRILLMAVLMAVSCLAVVAAVLFFFYKLHRGRVLSDLTATAQSQARLIEAIARYDSKYGGAYPGTSREATLSQLRDAHEKYKGFGETGEFMLAHKEGEKIVFEFRHNRHGVEVPESIPFDSDYAAPMQRALSGRSGTMIGKDYRGETVLAAYEPVGVLDMGIVAKMDMAEFRAPFIHAGLISLGITFLVVLGSMLAFRKISDPMLEKLENHAESLEQEVAERKKAQERSNHLNLILRAIRNVNQLITVEKDRDRLIKKACDSLVETRGFHNAWIVLIDQKGAAKTMAESGLGEGLRILQEMLDSGELPGCARKAMESSEEVVTRHPTLECKDCPLLRHLEYKGQASLTIRLEHEGNVFGVMSLSLPAAFVEDPEELHLFREVCGDIAYALHSIEVEKERNRTEQELKAGRERLSLIVNTVPVGITIVERDGKISFANPEAQSILGLSPDEALDMYYNDPGFTISSVDGSPFPDEDLPFNRVIKEGKPVFGVEHAIERPGGERIILSINSTPTTGPDGRFSGMVSSVLDITERKRMEEDLKTALLKLGRQESESRALFEAAHSVLETSGFEDSARKIFETCRQATGAVSGYVALLSDDGAENELLFLESGGLICTVDESLPMPVRGLRAEAYSKADVVYDNDFMNSEWVQFMPEGHVELKNVLFSPLIINAEVVGVIGMVNKPEDFNEDDMRLARALGDMVAIALRRARAEEELREYEEFTSSLIDAMTDGLSILDTAGVHVDANQALCLMTGFARDELIGCAPPHPYWPEEEYDNIEAAFRETLESGFKDHELVFKRKSGERFPVIVSPSLVRDEEGNVISYFATVKDMTELRRMEGMLRDSEHRLRNLMDNLPGIAYRCRNEPAWPMEFLSQGCKKLTGYEPDELLAGGELDYVDIIHPEDRDKVWEIVQEAVGEDLPFQIEYRILTRTVEQLWVWEQGQAIAGGTESDTMLEGIIVDITEKKQAEAALQESEKNYRELFESIRDAILVADTDRKIIDCNPAFTDQFGYSLDEIKGRETRYIYDNEEEFRMMGEELGKHVDSGLFLYTINYRKKSGKVFPGETSVFYLRDSDDNVVGFIGLIRDVSDRKQLEEQLNQAMKMEAVGRLAGGVAHDFNNALTPLMTISGALLKELGEQHPIYPDIKEIEQAGERCASLTRQLLAFGRRQALELEVLNINDVVADMEKMLGRLIGEDIELVKFLATGLGFVKADVGQMEQIVANLAVNARDAMPQGGQLTIETANLYLDEDYASTHPDVTPGPHIMMAVSDTGEGMDEDTRRMVFEPFFTTKEKGKGTGLGLSTVYGIVKQMGGNVWCYSEPGNGTTFKIYLPQVAADTEQMSGEDKVVPVSYEGTETVLLVEDEVYVRTVAKRILEKQGYHVLEALSGVEALGVCEKFEGYIHLMVTDVVMPGMSGKELAGRMELLYPEMKVLYMSGYTDNAIVHHGVLDRGTNFLQKPFNSETLARKVRQVLDGQ